MWKIWSCLFSLILLGGVALVPITLPVYAQDCPDGNCFGSDKYVDGIQGIPGTKDWLQGSSLLDTIKTAINWMLGLLATIALVLCLYAGFLVVTAAGNDANQKKGMTILKQAAMWIAIIGLSWLFVSLVFRIIGVMTKTS